MRAETFASAQDLLNSGRVAEAACLILDVRMPNMDGPELQRRLRENRERIPVVFISARATKEEEDRALRSGAVAFLRKPVGKDALLRVIHMALETVK
jgi:FixJ family two-component response regulator